MDFDRELRSRRVDPAGRPGGEPEGARPRGSEDRTVATQNMRDVRWLWVALLGGCLGTMLVLCYTVSLGAMRQHYAVIYGFPGGMAIAIGIYYLAMRRNK